MSYDKILYLARQFRKNATPAEEFFWQKVRNRQLLGKKFTRQFIIQHAEEEGTKRFFIADFYCHEKKLIVELDGGIHETQVEYDQLREEILLKMGFSVLRLPNEVVLHRWGKVEKQLIALLEAPG
jgi:very-short-patch-repair endonuclease